MSSVAGYLVFRIKTMPPGHSIGASRWLVDSQPASMRMRLGYVKDPFGVLDILKTDHHN